MCLLQSWKGLLARNDFEKHFVLAMDFFSWGGPQKWKRMNLSAFSHLPLKIREFSTILTKPSLFEFQNKAFFVQILYLESFFTFLCLSFGDPS
jgi:hypothetical protein